jgi:hypothetical protein
MATPAPIQLTRHENRTFAAQTVHLTGQAFVNCTFEGCTVVVTNGPFVTQNVQFRRCNWRVEVDILWGSPESRSALRRLLDLIDGAPDATGLPPRAPA